MKCAGLELILLVDHHHDALMQLLLVTPPISSVPEKYFKNPIGSLSYYRDQSVAALDLTVKRSQHGQLCSGSVDEAAADKLFSYLAWLCIYGSMRIEVPFGTACQISSIATLVTAMQPSVQSHRWSSRPNQPNPFI